MTQPAAPAVAHTNALPAESEGAAAIAPGASARLLFVLHRLVQYGKVLVSILQEPGAADFARRRYGLGFGTLDVSLIIARITRGLMRAAALEQRITQNAARIDAARKPAAPRARTRAASATPRVRRPAKRRPSPDENTRALLARMPTEEEIAAEVRRRPIGAVLAEICLDLGIGCDHPLWREIEALVMDHRGSAFRLVDGVFQQLDRLLERYSPDEPLFPELRAEPPPDPPDSVKPPSNAGPDPARRSHAFYCEITYQLGALLPPDSEETRPRAIAAAINTIAALRPVTAAEAVLAGRYVLASAHARAAGGQANRVRGSRRADRCIRHAIGMLRRTQRVMKALLAARRLRRKREAALAPAV